MATAKAQLIQFLHDMREKLEPVMYSWVRMEVNTDDHWLKIKFINNQTNEYFALYEAKEKGDAWLRVSGRERPIEISGTMKTSDGELRGQSVKSVDKILEQVGKRWSDFLNTKEKRKQRKEAYARVQNMQECVKEYSGELDRNLRVKSVDDELGTVRFAVDMTLPKQDFDKLCEKLSELLN